MNYGVKDIKKGDYFTESEYGMTVTLYATEDAKHLDATKKRVSGFSCKAVRANKDGSFGKEIVEYFASDEYEQYAPDITFVKNEVEKIKKEKK
jgi:hypothetical protein